MRASISLVCINGREGRAIDVSAPRLPGVVGGSPEKFRVFEGGMGERGSSDVFIFGEGGKVGHWRKERHLSVGVCVLSFSGRNFVIVRSEKFSFNYAK